MPVEPVSYRSARLAPPELVTGHILFMDIVGYSRLRIDQQTRYVAELQELVSTTLEFTRAQDAGRLIVRPSGDGMALIFFESILAPLHCALEIAACVLARPYIALRMGVNTGVLTVVRDVNGNRDVHGEGIVLAQRVMDFGDQGHILLAKPVAEMLLYALPPNWHLEHQPACKDKNGVFVEFYNFFTREYGNRNPPRKVVRAREEQIYRPRPSSRLADYDPYENIKRATATLLFCVALIGLAFGIAYKFNDVFREAINQTFHLSADATPSQNPPSPSADTGQSSSTYPVPRHSLDEGNAPLSRHGGEGKRHRNPPSPHKRSIQNADEETTFDRTFEVPGKPGEYSEVTVCYRARDAVTDEQKNLGTRRTGEKVPLTFTFESDAIIIRAQIDSRETESRTFSRQEAGSHESFTLPLKHDEADNETPEESAEQNAPVSPTGTTAAPGTVSAKPGDKAVTPEGKPK